MSTTLDGSSDRYPSILLIGRGSEQARLRAGLSSAVNGRGQLILLSGEPGIGKTRLAEWLAAELNETGTDVFWGRCYEGEGAPAYWPWSQILRGALSLHEADALEIELGADAAHLAQIAPEIEMALPDLAPIPAMNPEQARFRLFDAVTRLLKKHASMEPLTVILEDLHWADAPSLLLLQFLAAELRDCRLLVLGTYRNVEVQRQHPLSATLASLVREPVTHRVTLHRFTLEEVTGLIEQVSGTAPTTEIAEAVWRETEGNPFFVTEVVRLFDSAESSVVSGEGPLEIRIPESIRDVVGQRLDRLSPECNELLAVAAVVGREFDLSTLETATGSPGVELLSLLDEASQSQIIEAGEAFGRYRFSHRLIQETLYEELPTSRRFQLHSQIGVSLEARHAPDLRDYYGILAHHYSQAPLGTNIDKAIDYATKAAERAMRQVAWEEAVFSFELALQLLDLTVNADPILECDLLLKLGTAQAASGGGRGSTPGAATSRNSITTSWRAVEAARTANSISHLVQASLGVSQGIGGVPYSDYRVVPLLEEVLSKLPENSNADHALIQSMLAAGYRNFKLYSGRRLDGGSEDRIDRLSFEAVGNAKRSDNFFSLLVSRLMRSFAIWHPGHMDEIGSLIHSLLTETPFEQVEQYDAQPSVLVLLVRYAISEGDIAGARQAIGELENVSKRIPTPRSGWMAKATQAGVALSEGRYRDVKQLIDDQNEIWPGTGIAQNQFFALCRETDRLSKTESLITNMLDVFPLSPWFRVCWILLLAETGEIDAAQVKFSQLDIDAIADLAMGPMWPHILAFCAELSVTFGDVERASACYRLLLPYPDHVIFCGYIDYCAGSISHYLGLLAGFLGEWRKAEAHFEQALEQHQDMGFHPLAAHTQHSWARMVLKRGEADNRDRASELLDQASETADRLGMIRLQRLIAETREQFGPEVGEAFPFDLSQREVEVLRFVVEGMTDSEIAEELYLSPRTISTYLTSIYNKLGVNSRAAAAAITVRSGLA